MNKLMILTRQCIEIVLILNNVNASSQMESTFCCRWISFESIVVDHLEISQCTSNSKKGSV